MTQSKEEFFKSIKLPYYAKTKSGGSYYKVISKDKTIYVSPTVEEGIMISPYYWKSISNLTVQTTAEEFNDACKNALRKLYHTTKS